MIGPCHVSRNNGAPPGGNASELCRIFLFCSARTKAAGRGCSKDPPGGSSRYTRERDKVPVRGSSFVDRGTYRAAASDRTREKNAESRR